MVSVNEQKTAFIARRKRAFLARRMSFSGVSATKVHLADGLLNPETKKTVDPSIH